MHDAQPVYALEGPCGAAWAYLLPIFGAFFSSLAALVIPDLPAFLMHTIPPTSTALIPATAYESEANGYAPAGFFRALSPGPARIPAFGERECLLECLLSFLAIARNTIARNTARGPSYNFWRTRGLKDPKETPLRPSMRPQ
jgi:hypothetical protein